MPDRSTALPVLAITDLTLRFGGVLAVDRVTFSLHTSDIVGIVGPNGAGKTSLLNCVSGLYRATSGSIRLADRELAQAPGHAIVKAGIARTFQHVELVPDMTVADNVMAGCHHLFRRNVAWSALYFGFAAREESAQRRRTAEVLDLLGLAPAAGRRADSLTLVEQKTVEIARALAAEPRVLLLDEPSSGLAPSEKPALLALLNRLSKELGMLLVVVEHDLSLVRALCTHLVVLNYGQKLAEGNPEQVLALREVRAAYLGVAD